jgi:hypothetical protein
LKTENLDEEKIDKKAEEQAKKDKVTKEKAKKDADIKI